MANTFGNLETSVNAIKQTGTSLYSGGFAMPLVTASDQTKLGWLRRSLGHGMTFLQNQQSVKTLEAGINVLADKIVDSMPHRKLSKVKINRLKRQIREIISTMTNVNPRAGFDSDDEDLKPQAQILNKRYNNWWNTTFVDRSLKEALQYAILGAGYISPTWGNQAYGSESPDVICKTFSMMDVIPDGIARDNKIQRSHAVHLRDTMPLQLACATFPMQAKLGMIVADRYTRSGTNSTTRLLSKWIAPIFSALGMGGLQSQMTDDNSPFPEVDVYSTYISDESINETGMTIHSDELTVGYGDLQSTRGTTWEYSIPSIGSQQPTGMFRMESTSQTDEATGQQVEGSPQKVDQMKITTRKDAKLYPLRRLVIWTQNSILYDGPSFWWHGQVPVVKFTMDKWPWEFLGYSLVESNLSVQAALTSLLRGVVDNAELKLDPPLMFNEKEFSRKSMEELNIRVPGVRIPRSGMVAQPIEAVLDPVHYNTNAQELLPIMQDMKADMDYVIGVQDMSALAKLQQAPSAETIDRMLQAAGPLIHDYAREMEYSLTELAYQVMWLFLQFDTVARRLQIIGKDGITPEDFDFQPGSLIPDQIPGIPADAPLMRKALLHGRKFKFHIVPRSIFQVTDIQNKLFYLQLWRDGKFPIDPWTLAQVWNLPNFGEAPQGTINMFDRWIAWLDILTKSQTGLQIQSQMMMAQAQMAMQQQMAQQQMMNGPMGQLAQMLGAAQQGQPNGAPELGGGKVGRPPSGNAMPSIEQKTDENGGPRTTIAES